MIHTLFRCAAWAVLAIGAVCAQAMAAEADRPNIVLVLTDDQGYGDLSVHGNPVLKTPNIDRLHGQSVRFKEFHVSPTCAPTRTAILSGRHEFHSGVTHTINERERMALSAVTYADLLSKAGYATGIFGKWHLGDEEAYRPDKRGFGECFTHGAGGIGQSYRGSCGDAPGNKYFDPAILHNGKFEKTKGYCTDIFFDRALAWIESQQGKGPFYCHISTNAPHSPLVCPREYSDKYAGQPENVAKFFGMIANIDNNVGRLMAKLDELGMADNTLLIYMSDNGGTAGVKLFNDGMRGAKVTQYRGGTRVPAMWRLPSRFKPHDVTAFTAHVDMFPTFCELAGVKIPEEVAKKLDGRSLTPLLKDGDADWPRRTLVTHVGRWPKGQAGQSQYKGGAIRDGRFNLVFTCSAEQAELFDWQNDPGEKTNVREKFPEETKRLMTAYNAWWKSVQPDLVNENVEGPQENPFHTLYYQQFPDERPKKK